MPLVFTCPLEVWISWGGGTLRVVNKGAQLGKGRGSPLWLERQVAVRSPEEERKRGRGKG